MKLFKSLITTGDRFLQPISIVNTALPDRPLIYVNKAFTELTGYPSLEVVGKNCRFLQGPQTDPQTVQRIREAMTKKEAICQDLINYTRTGELMYNRLVLIPRLIGSEWHYFGLQHQINADSYKPIISISQSDLFDRTLNPLTVVLGTVELNLANPEKLFQNAVSKIKDFVLNL